MTQIRVCPLFTLIMNRETPCYGERCAWAIKEGEASFGGALPFSPVCSQWAIAAELRVLNEELRRLSQVPSN